MAILCRERRLLFIMAPRTGCSTVGAVLREQLGGEFLPGTDIYRDGRLEVPHKHSTLEQLKRNGLVGPELRREVLVFSGVRNPFDSLVSLYVKNRTTYQDLLQKPGSFVQKRSNRQAAIQFCATHTFDQWIEHLYAPRLRDRLLGRAVRERVNRWVDGVDVVMRFESLQQDFDAVLRQAGVEGQFRLPWMNRTKKRKRDYRSYYSERSQELVERAWRRDLERFGYTF
jgi:hypothetical protein